MEKKESRTGRIFRTIFNPKAWMDYEQVKGATEYLGKGAQKLFTLQEKSRDEKPFEEVMKEQGINEAQLLKQTVSLQRLAWLMLLVAFGVFSYAMYLLALGSYHGSVASLVIFFVVLSLSFRYHYWFYQLKNRQLGCSLREWFICGLLGVKK